MNVRISPDGYTIYVLSLFFTWSLIINVFRLYRCFCNVVIYLPGTLCIFLAFLRHLFRYQKHIISITNTNITGSATPKLKRQ